MFQKDQEAMIVWVPPYDPERSLVGLAYLGAIVKVVAIEGGLMRCTVIKPANGPTFFASEKMLGPVEVARG